MKNNEFRTPLIQSGALLVAIVFIISMIPSGDGMSVGSVIGGFFTAIFKLILFALALSLSVAISIAALIGIFIAAVALQSPEKASEIYTETKARIALLIQDLLASRPQIIVNRTAGSCSTNTESPSTGISQEEYDQMKSKISSLQNTNLQLLNDVSTLHSKNAQLQNDIHGLAGMVDELKESESKIKDLIGELSAKVKEDPDTDLKNQIVKLEEMVSKTNENISNLSGRLELLEESVTAPANEPQTGGIFSYIEEGGQRTLFTAKVEEGVAKDLTYAQFDEFFTQSFPTELDTIVKEHPSLTKDYIRSMRK